MKYRAHRYPTRFPVTVGIGPLKTKSTIFSVSTSGAGLHLDAAVSEGQIIVMEFFGRRLAGIVRWASGDRIGVAFERPLGQSDLAAMRFGVAGHHGGRATATGYSVMR